LEGGREKYVCIIFFVREWMRIHWWCCLILLPYTMNTNLGKEKVVKVVIQFLSWREEVELE